MSLTTEHHGKVTTFTWRDLTGAEPPAPLNLSNYAFSSLTVQVCGDFNSARGVTIHGSLDNSEWFPVPGGSFVEPGLSHIHALPLYLKPEVLNPQADSYIRVIVAIR